MTTSTTDPRVPVFGDWHGDVEWAKACVRWMAQEGFARALHVGDFAIGMNNNRQYTKPLNYLCAQLGIKLYITPGNHENYDAIEALPVIEAGEDAGWQRLASHLLVAPRGLRWNWSGVKFVSLGGGNSIDHRIRRGQGIDWWAAERITMADIYSVEAGGPADVMITHVAPNAANYDLDGSYWRPEDIRYSDESRMAMDLAVEAVRPKLLFHGHYHQFKVQRVVVEGADGSEFTTEFISLGMNTQDNNAAVLDLSNLSYDVIKRPLVEDPRRKPLPSAQVLTDDGTPERLPKGWASYTAQ